jgi:hypothetical protein
MTRMTDSPPQPARPSLAVVGLLCAAAVAAFLLNGFRVAWPVLQGDDFQIVGQSWTWAKTWDGIWVPQNEHAMPLGRVLTRLLIMAAGRPTNLAQTTALVGPCALLLGLPLVYFFVKRELGHPFFGLLAVILFGVTAAYVQAIYWFAAAYSVLALDTLLLALLAAQAYRLWDRPLLPIELSDPDDAYSASRLRICRINRLTYLILCAVLCALAPGWFASGILVGPLCCLYLFPAEPGTSFPTLGERLRYWLLRLTPMLGTVVFLALSLPHNARTIMHLQHYEMQETNALEAFRPDKGLLYTLRALVENLLLSQVGVWQIRIDWWIVICVLVVLFVGGWLWWRGARPSDRRLMLLGLGLIFASYWLVFSARSRWADDPNTLMCGAAWCRYNLGPQLGLAFFFCGGLPGRYSQARVDGPLSRRQVAGLAALIMLFFVIQAPRGITSAYYAWPEDWSLPSIPYPYQQDWLRYVEKIDACCRKQRISAEAARRVLPPLLEIEGSGAEINGFNGWDFLWGSDEPVERSDEEVKKLLWNCD